MTMLTSQKPNSFLGSRRFAEFLYWLLAFSTSFQFAQNFAFAMQTGFPLEEFAYARVLAPYRRRVLTEWVYRAYIHFHGIRVSHLGKLTVSPEQQILFALGLLGCFLAVVISRWMIVTLLGSESPFRWLSLVSVYMFSTHELLVSDIRAQFPYDVTSLVFFSTGMFAAFLKNRWLYYFAFIVGTFNRETTMFLPLLFLLAFLPEEVPLAQSWKKIKPFLVVEVVAQLVLWQAIVLFCERITGGHGRGMLITWRTNVFILANPRHWPLYLSTFGFLWIPVVLFNRKISNVRIRRFALVLPLWFLAMFYVGDPLEIRLYNEWIPYITLCLALILSSSIRFGERPGELVKPVVST